MGIKVAAWCSCDPLMLDPAVGLSSLLNLFVRLVKLGAAISFR